METYNPKYSVCITNYNSVDTIQESLESIFHNWIPESPRRRLKTCIKVVCCARNAVREVVDISIVGHSFSYTVQAFDWSLVLYLVSVSIPFLVSSKKGLVLFGVALTLSCISALIMATSSTFPSVWCFYAAILSASLYLYFNASTRNSQLTPQSV